MKKIADQISNLENHKYKLMGIEDCKDELRKEWVSFYNTNCLENKEMGKALAVSMRRLSNAFSCEEVKKYYESYEFPQKINDEIEQAIIFFHINRSEEFDNYINKRKKNH